MTRKRIVLFLPHRDNPGLGIRTSADLVPLELLQIATYPVANGYEVVMIDAMVHDDYEKRVLEACEGALVFATSCILGFQVYHGATVCRAVRAKFPKLPILWGGWFPTVYPELFLQNDVADAVGLGQGEMTFWDCVQALDAGTPLDDVPGLALWRDGKLHKTAHRPVVGFDEIPRVPWELLDYERYVALQNTKSPNKVRQTHPTPPGLENKPRRAITYYSSYGCPEPCTFCCSPIVTGRRWKAIPGKVLAERVLELHDRFKFDTLRYQDANFGVAEKRSNEWCEALIDAKTPFFWSATYEIETIARYKESSCDLLKDSRCYLLVTGAEAGTQEQQARIKKNIDIDKSLDLCFGRATERGMLTHATWIIGYPRESRESMLGTLLMAGKIKERYPLTSSVVYPFCPIPGSADWDMAVEDGYQMPTTLDEWGSFLEYKLSLDSSSLPQDLKTRLNRYAAYSTFRHDKVTEGAVALRKLLHTTAGWRLKRGNFALPVDLKLFDMYTKVTGAFGTPEPVFRGV